METHWWQRAQQAIPGGVNSPVRAFKSVGCDPIFISRADGPYIFDINGKPYIDFVGSWGPMIVGHNHPRVRESIQLALEKGTSFGACTTAEVEIAEKIISFVPSIEMVRLVNSGTEATMSAIRLARGVTGRDLIIKFKGNYHGHGDSFLIEAGSGALTFGNPSSPGVTAATARDTLCADFNQLGSVEKLFEEHSKKIAAVIVEPVAGNMGCVPPIPGFLEGLRRLCTREGTLLIFDEVMTGFRLARGGAQERYEVVPDLTTLGKIIGGGLPVGAYGGKKEIMQQLSPAGPIYQAGTLSGNPMATAAGLAMLSLLEEPNFYEDLERLAEIWESDLRSAFAGSEFPVSINRVGSMMTLFFKGEGVLTYTEATQSDTKRYGAFFRAMLDCGIYLAPSQFEAGFLSSMHSESILDEVATKTRLVAKDLR